jgi:hypothetical protein
MTAITPKYWDFCLKDECCRIAVTLLRSDSRACQTKARFRSCYEENEELGGISDLSTFVPSFFVAFFMAFLAAFFAAFFAIFAVLVRLAMRRISQGRSTTLGIRSWQSSGSSLRHEIISLAN